MGQKNINFSEIQQHRLGQGVQKPEQHSLHSDKGTA
jgi:hypothetical protein